MGQRTNAIAPRTNAIAQRTNAIAQRRDARFCVSTWPIAFYNERSHFSKAITGKINDPHSAEIPMPRRSRDAVPKIF